MSASLCISLRISLCIYFECIEVLGARIMIPFVFVSVIFVCNRRTPGDVLAVIPLPSVSVLGGSSDSLY